MADWRNGIRTGLRNQRGQPHEGFESLIGHQMLQDDLLDRVIKQCYVSVQPETGWKVLIYGKWHTKNDSRTRLYSSKASAKSFNEREFHSVHWNWYNMKFKKESLAADKVNYPDLTVDKRGYRSYGVRVNTPPGGYGHEEFDKDRTKHFRKWMNQLYKDGLVEYVEVT